MSQRQQIWKQPSHLQLNRRKKLEIFQQILEERSLKDKNQDIKRGVASFSILSELGGGFLWDGDPDFLGGNDAWPELESLSSNIKAGSLFV